MQRIEKGIMKLLSSIFVVCMFLTNATCMPVKADSNPIKMETMTDVSSSPDNIYKIGPQASLKNVSKVEVNGTNYEALTSKWSVFGRSAYYIDNNESVVYLGLPLENETIITFYSDNGVIGKFKSNGTKNFVNILEDKKEEAEETKPLVPETQVPVVKEKVEYNPEAYFGISAFSFENNDKLKAVDSFTVNGVQYDSVGSKFDVYSGDYYVDSTESKIYFLPKLNNNDKIVIKSGSEIVYNLSFSDGKLQVLDIVSPETKPETETEIAGIRKIVVNKAAGIDNANLAFVPSNFVKKVDGVKVNGNQYALGGSASAYGQKYFIDNGAGKIYFGNDFKPNDVITLSSNGQDFVEIQILENYGYKIKEISSTIDPVEPENPETQETPNEITSISYQRAKSTFNQEKLVIEPLEVVSKIDGFENGTVKYVKVSAAVSASDNHFYVDAKNGEIIFSPALKQNEVITLKSGDEVIGRFKVGADDKLTELTTPELSDKDLHVRLSGAFEAAVVNQKGYDVVSSATGSINTNTNSNVVVEVAESNKGEMPNEDAWTLLHDSEISLNTNDCKVTINDDDMGMEAKFHALDSSITLAGIPTKAGEFKVSVEIVDNLGRSATSNALSFNVYDLAKVKLSDQLKLENFKELKQGAVYEWDMEPWEIQLFDKDDKTKESTVVVPSELKLWNGSHTSGVYGALGYPVDQNEKPHQNLVLESGTELTLRNMKVLSSVNIVVKDGAKLNFYDSSLYGTITVENGGRFQMNYDEQAQDFSTGSSINGQLILKDGAILESSLIYSNANFLSDSGKARKFDRAVVSVEGEVTIDGQVYIRGDESATGNKPNGEAYTGQNALELKENAILNIPEGSLLGVYGGGQMPTTSIGGNGLILNKYSKVNGEGKLIAVGGNGTNDKAGNAITGVGEINVKEAYLEGGNNYSNKIEAGKAYGEDVVINPNTIGYAKDGKQNPSEEDLNKSAYWKGLKAPGVDKSYPNPLENANTNNAPTIIQLPIETIPFISEYVADDSLEVGTTKVKVQGINGSKQGNVILQPATNEVILVGTKATVEQVEIAHKVIEVENEAMLAGEENIKQAGENGLKEVTTTYKLDENHKAVVDMVSEVVVKEASDKIVELGTKAQTIMPIEKPITKAEEITKPEVKHEDIKKDEVPQTSDSSNIDLWMMVSVLSAATAVVLITHKKKED